MKEASTAAFFIKTSRPRGILRGMTSRCGDPPPTLVRLSSLSALPRFFRSDLPPLIINDPLKFLFIKAYNETLSFYIISYSTAFASYARFDAEGARAC